MVEPGPHEELMALDWTYAGLFTLRTLPFQ